MKKTVITVLLIALMCLLVGCNAEPQHVTETQINIVTRTPLDVPQITSVDGVTLTWTEVANAQKYSVQYVYEDQPSQPQTATAQGCSFDIPCTDIGVYSARVCAIPSENTQYSRSNYSAWVQVVSNIKDYLSKPQNVKFNGQTVTWNNVNGATGYLVEINNEIFATVTNSITSDKILPGVENTVRVCATVDGNVFRGNSDWTKTYTHNYLLEITAPTNVELSKTGWLTWQADNFIPQCGFTVSFIGNGKQIDAVTYDKTFDVTTVADGTYQIKVKTNGVGAIADSDYTNGASVQITNCITFTPQQIIGFETWANQPCTITLNQSGYAVVGSKGGWGGIKTDEFTVDFARNPVAVIDYAKVNYGYLGKFMLGTSEYYYIPDTPCNDVNVSLHNLMTTATGYGYSNKATGVRNDVRIMLGFADAPDVADDNRAVCEVAQVRVVYLEIIDN